MFTKKSFVISLVLVVGLLFAVAPRQAQAQTGTTIQVGVLDPSWTAPGGGGVYAAYYGPSNGYAPVSPGATAVFDSREAGIIKAGINIDPISGHYEDEGILAFKIANVGIADFASHALSYSVQNESGTNPVWARIRMTNSSIYQHLPASYGVGGGYHTIDAAAGSWQLMDSNGNGTGPLMSLTQLATSDSTLVVDRVYLTLGMGDSYNVSEGVGTVGWVDKVVIDTVTYDFVVIPTTSCTTDCYVNTATGADTFPGTVDFPFKTIQKGINTVSVGGTVHVAAGTYAETLGGWRDLEINKSLSLIGAGSELTIVELTGLQNGLGITADATGIVHLEGIKFTKHGTNINSAGWPIRIGGPGQTFNGITLKDIDVGYAGARNLHFEGTGTYNNIWIEDCYIHDSDIYGASISGPATGVTILNSKFNHNGWNDPGDYNTSSGKYTYHGYGLAFEKSTTDVEVTDSEFNDNGTNGINMSGVTNAVFDGITANGNGFWTPGLYDGDLGVNFWEFTTGSSNLVFKNSIFNGNQRGGLAFGSEWGKGEVHNIEITGCEIKDNSHHSLLLWFDTPYSGINIHHNRIIHTGDDIALVGLLSGTQNLPDNWWGCNEGFDQPGCAWGQWALTGSFAFPSHLVMNVSTDTPFTPGGTSTFTADLTYNNLGVDTSDDGDPLTTDDGHLPPATVSFTPIDHVTPDTALLASGAASTTFAAPVPSGSFDVCATLDNETVCLPYVHDVPIITYADDSWVGYTDGTPVTVGTETHYIGYDAFDTILKAKTAVVADGGTVRVLAGTYNEAVLLDKLNLTVESLDGAAVTIIDIPDGTLTTGVKTFKNLGVITFDGFTVKDFTESGIIQGYGERAGTTFHVLNNIVKPAGTYLRNGIQVSGADSTVIGNTVYGQYLTEDWASTCIGVVNASGVLVQGNTIYGPADNGIAVYSYTGEVSDVDVIENVIEGVDYPLSVDAYYSGSTVTGVDFYRNSVTGYVIPMSAVPYPGYDGGPITNVDATYNYWGNPCGPSAVIGDVPYSPWYTDDTLTTTSSTLPAAGIYTFAPGATTAEMQTIINCAAPGSVINYASGSYPGGLVVGRDELTFNLNGVTVGAGSPAFDIYGDDIVINGPGKFDGLGAADPAIYVNTGADNFILDGVEITGWTDGVYVGGAVESLKIVNNWIHTNSGRGLVVDGTPTGVVTIKGNLFKANADAGVLYLGEGQLDATYNSWGSPTGPVGLDADKVLSTPFNFYELYFDMDPVVTGEQAWRRVAVSQTFNVALKADAANVYGLSFKFTYDPTKVVLNLTTFDAAWLNKCTMVGTPPLGTVEYFCNLTSGDPEWQGGTIATFNLTAIGSAVESFFDVFTELPFTTEPVSPTAGAVGGVKVWVNNAGYNEPFGHGLLTDEDDGRLTIDGIAQFTGFVDLEGRPNDSGALLQVFDGASVLKAKALSESSGKYTTVYEPGMWMVVSTVSPEYSVPYYLIFDRDLFLPTPLVEKFLTQEGLTTLALLKLLGGDGTNNNYIDIADAGCIGRAYGTTNNVCGTFDPILNPTPIPGANSDVTGDGIVNIYDLTLMGGNFYMGFSQW